MLNDRSMAGILDFFLGIGFHVKNIVLIFLTCIPYHIKKVCYQLSALSGMDIKFTSYFSASLSRSFEVSLHSYNEPVCFINLLHTTNLIC